MNSNGLITLTSTGMSGTSLSEPMFHKQLRRKEDADVGGSSNSQKIGDYDSLRVDWSIKIWSQKHIPSMPHCVEMRPLVLAKWQRCDHTQQSHIQLCHIPPLAKSKSLKQEPIENVRIIFELFSFATIFNRSLLL